jgi:hypothetical protein
MRRNLTQKRKGKNKKKTIYMLPQECLIWSERKLFEKDSLTASGPKFFGGSIYLLHKISVHKRFERGDG